VLVAVAAAAVLAVGTLLGGVLGELRPAVATPVGSQRLELDAALPLGGTAVAVTRLERAVEDDPRDADRLGELGLVYQLRWRETGDPSFLPLSERALRDALDARPRDAAATIGLGNLSLIRHDFRGALALGREARRRAPFAARPYGVIGDALVELGRYPQAFAAFDRMTAVRPSLASYARVAYAR
jgi:tetratricopeptide (TPR) repeat protein